MERSHRLVKDTGWAAEVYAEGGGGVILSRPEIVELTERERIPAQRKVLDALGISYRLRPDGSIVIFREALNTNASAQNRPPPPSLRLSAAR